MSLPTFLTIPPEIRKPILEEAFAGSRIPHLPLQQGRCQVRPVYLHPQPMPRRIEEHEPLTLPTFANSQRRVYAIDPGILARSGLHVAQASNHPFALVVASRQLYQESLSIFVRCATQTPQVRTILSPADLYPPSSNYPARSCNKSRKKSSRAPI